MISLLIGAFCGIMYFWAGLMLFLFGIAGVLITLATILLVLYFRNVGKITINGTIAFIPSKIKSKIPNKNIIIM